jgi:putative transposon-encoded protein
MGKNATKEEKAKAGPSSGNEAQAAHNNMVKFEVFGEEMLEKTVKPSGNSGRVYLPPDWVGSRVKVIRVA